MKNKNKNEDIKLYNGDCLEVIQELINNNIKVDAIIADPPYGSTNHNWDNIISFKKLWPLLKEIRRNKNTPIIMFASNKFATNLELSNRKWYRYKWYWNKEIGTGFLDVAYKPLSVIEEILVFIEKPFNLVDSEEVWKKKDRIAQYFPLKVESKEHSTGSRLKDISNDLNTSHKTKQQLKEEYVKLIGEDLNQSTYKNFKDPSKIKKTMDLINKGGGVTKTTQTHSTTFYREGILRVEHTNNTLKQPKNLITFKKEKPNSYTKHHHPTQKPLELLKYLVELYTRPNETVLDFSCGSGVLGEACAQLNRKAILIEKEIEYINMTLERLYKYEM